MNKAAQAALSNVPEVTLTCCLIQIAATTLGETGGDSVTMTLQWGYQAVRSSFTSSRPIAAKYGVAVNDLRLRWPMLPISPGIR